MLLEALKPFLTVVLPQLSDKMGGTDALHPLLQETDHSHFDTSVSSLNKGKERPKVTDIIYIIIS